MAKIAGSYELFTVFDNLYTSVFFGFIWGLLIFNLDRFIVNSKVYTEITEEEEEEELYAYKQKMARDFMKLQADSFYKKQQKML